MPRDIRTYLYSIVENCGLIEKALDEVDFAAYQDDWEKRAVVERLFISIGEAAAQLRDQAPKQFESITNGHQLIGFRNKLTHAYLSIDDETVYKLAKQDAPILREECAEFLDRL